MIISEINWQKVDNLLPAIVQDHLSGEVLMLGYMNKEALEKTLLSQKVTFWSRTKNALWTKGETTGHFLNLVSLHLDCDQDSLLVLVDPIGPTCHRMVSSCFSDGKSVDIDANEKRVFLNSLAELIHLRKNSLDSNSYVQSLLGKDKTKVLQKVGEEAVEFILAATEQDKNNVLNEAADLLFHFLVALEKIDISYKEVLHTLRVRRK